MKLAQTEAIDFNFGLKVEKADDGWMIGWFRKDAKPDMLLVNEAYIRARVGKRELAEASNIYVELDGGGRVATVHNKMATTLATKTNGKEYALQNNVTVGAQIYIPFPDSPFSEWVLRVNYDPEVSDSPKAGIEVLNSLQSFQDFADSLFPRVSASVVSKDGELITLKAQLTQGGKALPKKDVRIFVSSPVGYVNKREIYTDAKGVAMVKVRRLDLDPSDKMSVEFGFKFTSNVASVEV